MNDQDNRPQSDDRQDFLSGAESDRIGLVSEFWAFLKNNKKWWLIPILLMIAIGLIFKTPWTVAFAFGLLHGLGLTGAVIAYSIGPYATSMVIVSLLNLANVR